MSVPVPGQDHPAVVHLREAVLSARDPWVRFAIPQDVTNFRLDAGTMTLDDALKYLEFTRQQAAQSLYPEYGAYVWSYWSDQFGRAIVGEAEWHHSPGAHHHPEWNPTKEH